MSAPRRGLTLYRVPDGEWSALYVDGTLDVVGDHYLAEDRIFQLCDVLVVDDDAFLLGQDSSDGVAQTLDEVHAWQVSRAARLERAAELRAQAKELLERAEQMER